MATVTLTVPDGLMQDLEARLGEHGTSVIKSYLIARLQDLAYPEGMPIDAETEAALREGIESPLIEMTDVDWEAKVRRYAERHAQMVPGP